jgi:Arc/MetJ-type ribon-helix-helix transcriptional regulator
MRRHDNLEKEGQKMNLEIHNPELLQRVNAHIQTGHFHDADELLEKALDALDERAPAAAATATGAVVLAALEARPYPDIDLTPPRVRLTNVRDVVL